MIVILLGGLVLLSAFGLAVLALVHSRQRSILLPAAPLLGAAYLVVVLHLTGLFLPVAAGIWIAVALAVAAVAASIARNRSLRMGSAADWLNWGLVLAVGSVGATVAALPSFLANRSSVVQPGLVNDAFYYVSVAKWLAGHPVTDLPDIGTSPLTGADAPVFGPAFDSLNMGLRLGQELVQAGLATLTATPVVDAFSPWLGLWVLLAPGGAWVIGAAFGLTRPGRLALGGILATSVSLINQVLNQNADSLLGIALVPLLIGTVVSAVRRTSEDPRVPLWVAALILSATIGTYTEYIPFLGLILGALVLLRPPAELRTAVLRAAAIVGLAVAIAPLVWLRAVQSSLFLGTVTVGGGQLVPSPTGIAASFLGRYRSILLGEDPANLGRLTVVSVIVVIIAAFAGAILTLTHSRTRAYGIGVALSGAVVVYIAARGNPYITSRAVDMITPLVIIAAVLGWSNVIRWFSGRRSGVPVLVTAALTVVTLGVVVTAVTVSVRHIVATWDPKRSVGDDHAEAAMWLEEVGGTSGREASVAVATLFDQLWLSEATSNLPDVSYVNVRGDLGYRGNLELTSYWDGERDPYILIGPGAFYSSDTVALVEQNDTYRLLDLRRPATVVIPVGPGWEWDADDDGRISSSGVAGLSVITSESSLNDVALRLSGLPASVQVTLLQDGQAAETVESTGGDVLLPLDAVVLADGQANITVDVADATQRSSVTLEGLVSE